MLAVLATNGLVLVWTEVRPAAAAWTVDPEARAREAFARPVVRLQQLVTLSLRGQVDDGETELAMRLLVPPTTPDTVLVTHANGVEAVRLNGRDQPLPSANQVVTIVDVVAVAGAGRDDTYARKHHSSHRDPPPS